MEGVLLGMRAIAAGSSPYRSLNLAYHAVMLVPILVRLPLLLPPGVRAAQHHAENETETKMAHA